MDLPSADTRLRFRGVELVGESFDPPIYYGFRGGYFFSRHIGVEAEFIHLKVLAQVDRTVQAEGVLQGVPINADIPMSSVVERFGISHGLNFVLGNVVLRKSFLREADERRGRIILSGRVGVGGTVPHPESNILGASEQHYEGGRPAVQVAGGLEFRIWRGLYWLGEYKYTRTKQRVGIVGGRAETLVRTHHIVTGLSFYF